MTVSSSPIIPDGVYTISQQDDIDFITCQESAIITATTKTIPRESQEWTITHFPQDDTITLKNALTDQFLTTGAIDGSPSSRSIQTGHMEDRWIVENSSDDPNNPRFIIKSLDGPGASCYIAADPAVSSGTQLILGPQANAISWKFTRRKDVGFPDGIYKITKGKFVAGGDSEYVVTLSRSGTDVAWLYRYQASGDLTQWWEIKNFEKDQQYHHHTITIQDQKSGHFLAPKNDIVNSELIEVPTEYRWGLERTLQDDKYVIHCQVNDTSVKLLIDVVKPDILAYPLAIQENRADIETAWQFVAKEG
ncbi:hypothetical protein BGZ49_004354 [Haplosporangium sp. Z 27]|nr:hypothetical protein BGZ49_004354 [Haplosporangium sp. Z 27]